jgi:hypothetical protein
MVEAAAVQIFEDIEDCESCKLWTALNVFGPVPPDI